MNDPAYVKRLERFFESRSNWNINYAMYSFGVQLRSYHQMTVGPIVVPHNPVKSELASEWDWEIYTKVELGKDDEGNFDEKEGEDFWIYIIKRAVEFDRPHWALFHLIGNFQGYLNGKKMSKEFFCTCINTLRSSFIEMYAKDFLFLFSYFDELDLELSYDHDRNIFAI